MRKLRKIQKSDFPPTYKLKSYARPLRRGTLARLPQSQSGWYLKDRRLARSWKKKRDWIDIRPLKVPIFNEKLDQSSLPGGPSGMIPIMTSDDFCLGFRRGRLLSPDQYLAAQQILHDQFAVFMRQSVD